MSIKRSIKSLSLLLVMALSLTFIPVSYGASPVNAVTKSYAALFNGPDTSFNAPMGLPYQTTVPVLGRTPENAWLQVEYQARIGWIQAAQVTLTGNLGSVPAFPAVKAGDVASVLAHFCTHPIAIPAAPIWPAGGEFQYHPDIDTLQVHDATTDELSDMNYYSPFYGVQSDLPAVIVCLTDDGVLPAITCPYVDTSTGKPFNVEYDLPFVDVKVLSVHTGQVVQLGRFSGQPDTLYDYQQVSTTFMTNQHYKDIAAKTGLKLCPDHASPDITKMSGERVTPAQVYSLFQNHQQCTAGSPGCPVAATPTKSS